MLDRGYFSFYLVKSVMERKANCIFRMQGNLGNREIKKFEKSSINDRIIEYTPSLIVQSDLKKAGYEVDATPISLRLIKYTIEDKKYCFVQHY
jgi:hypothetical protein